MQADSLAQSPAAPSFVPLGVAVPSASPYPGGASVHALASFAQTALPTMLLLCLHAAERDKASAVSLQTLVDQLQALPGLAADASEARKALPLLLARLQASVDNVRSQVG